jgi:protein-S-isoprenylcysteine O-methyltransferase Ste14
MSQKISQVFKPAAWLFYLVIGIEILYMISPFALYYYSTYGPSLNFLHASPLTSWLTGFFLPHYVDTSSALLNGVEAVGQILVVSGLLLFLIGAGHIYYYKFRKKGAVTGGLYRIIRHPQYTSLAVMGLGLLLVWPRFTVLFMYVSMLFVYFWLARKEEAECEEKFGESYRAYQADTRMFLPFSWPKLQLLEKLPNSRGRRIAIGLSAYVVALGVALAGAFEVRDYSLSQVSTLVSEDAATISAATLVPDEMQEILRIAGENPDVRSRLPQSQNGAVLKYLNYLVPAEWYLPDVPMEKIPEGFHGHHKPSDYDRNLYTVLFTKAKFASYGAVHGADIIKKAVGREPLLLAKVDRAARKVISVETPPSHVQWGDIPTPLF